jgi:hypothetical protein
MSHPDTRRCSMTADLLDLIAEADGPSAAEVWRDILISLGQRIDELAAEAEAAKQAGISSVGYDRWWQATAEQTVRALAQRGEPFQVFQAVLLGCPEPSSPAQWGSLTHRLAKAGVIRSCGFAASLRPTVRGSACRVWVGA